MILTMTEIRYSNKLYFSYFLIVSPPPILGRDEPNSR